MPHSTVPVDVFIPPDLDCDGIGQVKTVQIDAEIAAIVRALQAAGVTMRGSCSGHGYREGIILLQDGRSLLILPSDATDSYMALRDCYPEPLWHVWEAFGTKCAQCRRWVAWERTAARRHDKAICSACARKAIEEKRTD